MTEPSAELAQATETGRRLGVPLAAHDPDGSRRRAAFPPCTSASGEHCLNCPRRTVRECIADARRFPPG